MRYLCCVPAATRETCKRMPLKRAPLSVGIIVGDPGRGSFSGTFERHIKEGSGNGPSLIKLTLGSFFGPRLCKEPEFGGNLELL
jgi:hypothetical protein